MKLRASTFLITALGWTQVTLGQNKSCPTPDISELEEWVSDIRAGIMGADYESISSQCAASTATQKVLVIGVDGLRAGAAAMLPLPAFRRIESMGTYSYWATTQMDGVSVSGPGWASLYTGVEPTKHMVDGNHDVTDIAHAYPSFMKATKDTFGKTVAASVTWGPLLEMVEKQDPNTLDASFDAENDADMVETAVYWLENEDYDVVFTAFDRVDSAGHNNGFDGYLTSYMEAVMSTDLRIGKLLDAVSNRNKGEEWLIVLTTDHGGKDYSHGPKDYYNTRIPFMVASNSPRVAIGRAPHDDPGSQMDVLPTVMHFLGGAEAVPDGLDGQPFGFQDFVRTPPSTSECAGSDPETCGCVEVLQADYRGTIAETVSGRTCQAWSSQEPHDHSNTPENKPWSGLDANYCRNPDGEDTAWCYTTDPDMRWEPCAIPACGGACGDDSNPFQCGCENVAQADYRGNIAETASGKACQRWDSQEPHAHSRSPEEYPDAGLAENYCRNPDGEDGGAWCYTTDENTRWDYCDVPTC